MTAAARKKAEQRAHFAWQEMVAARTDIAPKLKIVAWALALFRNVENGRCDPSYAGLAERAGASESTAKRAIAALERLGLIAVERTPGGAKDKRNAYRLLMPEGVSKQTPLGVSGRGVRRGSAGVSELRHTNTKKNNKGLGCASHTPSPLERELRASRESISPDRAGRLDGAGRSGFEDHGTIERPSEPGDRKEFGAEEIAGGAVVPLDQHRACCDLLALWRRGWPGDESPKAVAIARNAFAKACTIAKPSEIMADARVHVAAADAPRFLPQLATWLATRGWEKPPPTPKRAVARRDGGNGRGRRSNGYGAKPDMFKIVLEAAAIARMPRATWSGPEMATGAATAAMTMRRSAR